MIPNNLTTQQVLILASLPSGILTTTAAQNALPHLSGQSVRAAIKKLIDQHYLVSCSCTVRDRKSEKHKVSYYKLTGKAVSDIFPSLFTPVRSCHRIFLILHSSNRIRRRPVP